MESNISGAARYIEMRTAWEMRGETVNNGAWITHVRIFQCRERTSNWRVMSFQVFIEQKHPRVVGGVGTNQKMMQFVERERY